MLKRFWALVLSLVFVLSISSVSAYASDDTSRQIASLSDESIRRSDYSKIGEEIDLMKNYFVFLEEMAEITGISKRTTGSKQDIWYTIRYDNGIVNDICVVENSETRVSFQVLQDELSNVLSFEANEIFLNGHEVEISSQSSAELATANIMPRDSDTTFVATCPYGTAGDYSRPFSSEESDEEVDNIVFGGNRVVGIVFSAFVTFLTYKLTLGMVQATGTAVSALVGIVAGELYDWLNTNFPNTYGISYKAKYYWHKSCGALSAGYISGYGAYVTKYIITWYSDEEFVNEIPNKDIAYKVHTIY